MLHSSDLEPEGLRRVLADQAARDEARGVRRYFVTRLAVIAAAAWLAGRLDLIPDTVFWALLATASLAIGLMWGPRTRGARRDTQPTHPR